MTSSETISSHEQAGEDLTIILDSMCGGRNIALLLAMSGSGVYTSADIMGVYQEAIDIHNMSTPPTRGFANAQLGNADDRVITCIDEGNGTRSNPALYAVTSFGRERCLATATQVARLCQRYDISPLALVGNRSSSRTDEGLEAPFTRLGIYATLLDRGADNPIAIRDVIKRSGLDARVIHNHLPALLQSELIVGSSDGSRKKLPDYHLLRDISDLDIQAVSRFMVTNQWSQRKRNLMSWVTSSYCADSSGSNLTVEAIYRDVERAEKIEDFFRSKQRHKQNEAIAQVLDILAEHGILQAKDDAVQERTTHIQFTETGKQVIYEYIQIIAGAILNTPGFRALGEDLALEKASDPHFINWLLRVDLEKGASTQREKTIDKRTRLVELLGKGALSTNHIMAQTGWQRRAAHNVLRSLCDSGEIVQSKSGRESIWEIIATE